VLCASNPEGNGEDTEENEYGRVGVEMFHQNLQRPQVFIWMSAKKIEVFELSVMTFKSAAVPIPTNDDRLRSVLCVFLRERDEALSF
jgi:hypothetical protein